ncbi:MAG TPA: leucine-rich repeat domain-containing protein, partial [Tepidisphaeraceae bacterium]|nr:leucine-rich repeat domain-containing protein [Tepidisphaeraceae bacterium]
MLRKVPRASSNVRAEVPEVAGAGRTIALALAVTPPSQRHVLARIGYDSPAMAEGRKPDNKNDPNDPPHLKEMQARLAAYGPAKGEIDLFFDDIRLTPEDCVWAVRQLADKERFPGLHTLDIAGNSIGEEGAKAIAGALEGCPGLTGLHTLNI